MGFFCDFSERWDLFVAGSYDEFAQTLVLDTMLSAIGV
jgi:hypothetical protein